MNNWILEEYNDEITHVCSLGWGMTVGEGNLEERVTEQKKKMIVDAFARIGFVVISQTVEMLCEGCRIITRAEIVRENASAFKDGIEITHGGFYKLNTNQ